MGLVAHTVKPPRPTEGPYRDIDAAVRFAAPRVDMAVLDADAADPTNWRYTLLTTRDETVILDIHMPPDPDPSRPVHPTSITARIQPLADPARQKALVREIENRLDALRPTGIAPE